MRIKTITCHDVYNAGASLQAYALATYLQKQGHEVEIIDYKPEYLSGHYRLWGGVNSTYDKPIIRIAYQMVKFPGRLLRRLEKRRSNYDAFTQKYLPLTEQRYVSNEDLKNNLPEADVYFAGSDQIWNTLFKNGRDPTFYLDFVPDTKIKASYAASFATEDIVEEWKNKVVVWLKRLDFISVRENSGRAILEKLGFENIATVLDPVFLLNKEQWGEITVKDVLKEEYLLVYDFDANIEVEKFAKKMAKDRNWKIFSIFRSKYADRCFVNEGPEMFLTLIENASFVISNSFHATAFSLIFQKEFVVFKRKEGINTRMADLVNLVGVSERVMGASNEQKWDKEIDYQKIHERMDKEIEQSKKYIKSVLNMMEKVYD